ncbi:MAG: hypothetical protein JO199_00835 [Candidatus Eremiobacteraeota bacterium]|nr:hypothetical protein [Candidatus Eremiobacteraeota bacterium]
MKDAVVRELAAALDSTDVREVRARHAAEIVRAARGYRWVGIYEVDDDRITILGHTGPDAPAFPTFDATQGLTGEVVRTRTTTFGSTGSELIVPILGAESGMVIGTLDVESATTDAFGSDDAAFLEACATALMPLYE